MFQQVKAGVARLSSLVHFIFQLWNHSQDVTEVQEKEILTKQWETQILEK